MIGKFLAVAALGSAVLWADFSYEQTSKFTGGAMAGMMRLAGAFSKSAREPMRTTVMVKGNRLATVSSNSTNIVDLDAETITDIDHEKKTYSVMTFAEMTRALQQMAEKMGQARKPEGAEVQFKANVKDTGASRVISGLNAKQTVVEVAMEGRDQKTGESAAVNFVMDMWMAPDVPGYDEVRNFYIRMAQKLSWNPSAGAMGPMMAQYGKGMNELYKEMAKLDGVPVLQITRIGGVGQGMPSDADMAALQQAQEQQSQTPQPTVQEAAGDAAAGAATGAAMGRLGRLGGLGGGLGGFGRRKKQDDQTPPAAQETQQQQARQQASGAPAGTLVEMTTELSSFSSGSVDGSKLVVPAGFKQIEHPMAKGLK